MRTKFKSKAYRAGYNSYHKNLKWSDNPFKVGSHRWELWNTGRSDYGDKDFERLFTEMKILQNS